MELEEAIRCLGGSVERIRALRERNNYSPEAGHRANLAEEGFGFEDLAGYAFDFAAAQLATADDHLLALEGLLLEGRTKVAPFVLGRAAIEASGRAYLFMEPSTSPHERAALVLSERVHELQSLRKLILARDRGRTSERVLHDLAKVEYEIEALRRYALDHDVRLPDRPSFTRVLSRILALGTEHAGFSAHRIALLSAIAHSVPDTIVALALDPEDPRWAPQNVGFAELKPKFVVDLVLAVLLAHHRAVALQIRAYDWPPSSWKRWRGHVRAVLRRAISRVRRESGEDHRSERERRSSFTLLTDPETGGPLSEETIESWGVEAMEDAGIDPAFIHAFRQTGRLVADTNKDLLSEEDLDEWREAVEEYRRGHGQEE